MREAGENSVTSLLNSLELISSPCCYVREFLRTYTANAGKNYSACSSFVTFLKV